MSRKIRILTLNIMLIFLEKGTNYTWLLPDNGTFNITEISEKISVKLFIVLNIVIDQTE